MIFYHPRTHIECASATELLIAIKAESRPGPNEPLEIHLTQKELCIIVNALDSINMVLGRKSHNLI